MWFHSLSIDVDARFIDVGVIFMKLVSPSKARFVVSVVAALFVGGALGQDPLGYGVFSKINAAYNQWHLFDRVSGVSPRAAWASSTGG